jgi:hypothetical protein
VAWVQSPAKYRARLVAIGWLPFADPALQRHENLCYNGCAPRIMPENVPAACVHFAILRRARTSHDSEQGERR